MQHILNKLKNMENVPKVDLKNGILSSLDNRQIRDHSIKKKKISTRSPALTQRSASEPKSTSNMSGNFVHNFPKHQQSTATVSGCYSYLQVHMPTQPNSSNEFLRYIWKTKIGLLTMFKPSECSTRKRLNIFTSFKVMMVIQVD
ncbi:uncharacterized protein LOC107982113 isoform X9 [Nasonia vitripennis]|uniref:Uncharacterized protein n=1 Tax=Nasonia vitripennis TaxID=7425 RepID=A0A7M7QN08_NASVI|nr:uncharacterized protein LOC107982113 isoform X9 [Nasonia vitripennis]